MKRVGEGGGGGGGVWQSLPPEPLLLDNGLNWSVGIGTFEILVIQYDIDISLRI